MASLATLRPLVAADLRDSGMVTFSSGVLDELINMALAEIGRLIPVKFRIDLTPVANQTDYVLPRAGSELRLTTPFGAASTDTLTSTAHGLTAGTAVRFTSLSGGTGLTVGTTYYVIAGGLTADAFKVSATSGGAALDFTTDITAGSLVVVGTDDLVRDVEVMRVEVIDKTTTPPSVLATLGSRYSEFANSSAAGWEVWNDVLSLTPSVAAQLVPATHLLRVWGYSPYARLSNSPANKVELSVEQEYALRDYVRIEAIKMLLASRELFTQWQTASRNTDVTLAGLAGLMNILNDSWRRRSRALMVLREVG